MFFMWFASQITRLFPWWRVHLTKNTFSSYIEKFPHKITLHSNDFLLKHTVGNFIMTLHWTITWMKCLQLIYALGRKNIFEEAHAFFAVVLFGPNSQLPYSARYRAYGTLPLWSFVLTGKSKRNSVTNANSMALLYLWIPFSHSFQEACFGFEMAACDSQVLPKATFESQPWLYTEENRPMKDKESRQKFSAAFGTILTISKSFHRSKQKLLFIFSFTMQT